MGRMRFLISVIDSEENSGTGDEMAAIDAFNDGLKDAGYFLLAVGIASPSSAVTFDNRAGAGIVTEGSSLYGNEYQSGFWLINVPDADVAKELAAAGSRACNRKVELRALLGG